MVRGGLSVEGFLRYVPSINTPWHLFVESLPPGSGFPHPLTARNAEIGLIEPLEPPSLEEVQRARARIADVAVRTPLVRLPLDAPTDALGSPPVELYLKLESLQPIGSFKLRGALNAIRAMPPERLRDGVYTTSAGNMAQGLAWAAREIGVPCRIVAPDHIPRTKADAIVRLGATVRTVPFAEWWAGLTAHHVAGERGVFVHPGADRAVMAGNGTIGLEILEDLPEVDAVLVPYGSGGLACGIAAAVRTATLSRPVYAVELDGRAPYAAALAAGTPVTIPYAANFVDSMGGTSVLAEMWPLARASLAGSLSATLAQVADAIRLLVDRVHVVAEGAGAAPVAAALANNLNNLGRTRHVVCVVSGGNIDAPSASSCQTSAGSAGVTLIWPFLSEWQSGSVLSTAKFISGKGATLPVAVAVQPNASVTVSG